MKLYSYKVRLYPNQSQKDFLCKQFGCCRFVYNKMLDLKISTFKNEGKRLSKFDLIKQLTPLKRMDEFKFLNEVINSPLVQAISSVDKAFTNFSNTKQNILNSKHSNQDNHLHTNIHVLKIIGICGCQNINLGLSFGMGEQFSVILNQ